MRNYMRYDSPEETKLYRDNHWAKRVTFWNLADIVPSGNKTFLLVRNQIQKVMNRFFYVKKSIIYGVDGIGFHGIEMPQNLWLTKLSQILLISVVSILRVAMMN